jgi:two-component system, NarL family, response regulator NreC
MTCRILLADDHTIVRQGLRNLLEQAGHRVVGEASDGRQALELAESLHPDLCVVDLSMPLLNGLDVVHQISRLDSRIRTILLTMHVERQYAVRALKAGARGYVLKTQAGDDLLKAIVAVNGGDVYVSPAVAEVLVDVAKGKRAASGDDPLSGREREVLQLVAEGRTSKEVAILLHMSPKTADSHRMNIMKKLDIHDVAGLVRYAIRRGLIHLEPLEANEAR